MTATLAAHLAGEVHHVHQPHSEPASIPHVHVPEESPSSAPTTADVVAAPTPTRRTIEIRTGSVPQANAASDTGKRLAVLKAYRSGERLWASGIAQDSGTAGHFRFTFSRTAGMTLRCTRTRLAAHGPPITTR
jgi:hypothetical protein